MAAPARLPRAVAGAATCHPSTGLEATRVTPSPSMVTTSPSARSAAAGATLLDMAPNEAAKGGWIVPSTGAHAVPVHSRAVVTDTCFGHDAAPAHGEEPDWVWGGEVRELSPKSKRRPGSGNQSSPADWATLPVPAADPTRWKLLPSKVQVFADAINTTRPLDESVAMEAPLSEPTPAGRVTSAQSAPSQAQASVSSAHPEAEL